MHAVDRGMLCLGCGSDLTGRSADRRRLASPASRKVVIQWKQIALEDDNVNESELDSFVNDIESGKMCRKCFATYEHFQEYSLRCIKARVDH